jgi:hypothetical protein
MKLTEQEVLDLLEAFMEDPTIDQTIEVYVFWQDEDPTTEELLEFMYHLEQLNTPDDE